MGKLFGSKAEKDIKELTPVVEKIKKFESEFSQLSNDELRAKTAAFKTGFSIVEDWGYVGLSFKNIENVYGIPFHGEHEEEEGGEAHGEERIESTTD